MIRHQLWVRNHVRRFGVVVSLSTTTIISSKIQQQQQPIAIYNMNNIEQWNHMNSNNNNNNYKHVGNRNYRYIRRRQQQQQLAYPSSSIIKCYDTTFRTLLPFNIDTRSISNTVYNKRFYYNNQKHVYNINHNILDPCCCSYFTRRYRSSTVPPHTDNTDNNNSNSTSTLEQTQPSSTSSHDDHQLTYPVADRNIKTKPRATTPTKLDDIITTHPSRESTSESKGRDPEVTTTTTQQQHQQHGITMIDRFIPKSYQPYAYLARLDKPIGTMLLFWPCAWSIGLASTPFLLNGVSDSSSNAVVMDHILSNMYILSLFGIGAIVMRGAGCTINDIWDRKYDQHVSRTKDRPLVTGVVSVQQAIQFVVLQSTIGLCILLSLHPHIIDCIYWGCLSLPLVIIYPTTKRYFPYPQLVLGMTFNWGAILGWVAVHGSSNIDWSIVGPLYGSGITWTLIYDTLYAHQDKKDDAKLKLHSTAITFGPDDDRQRLILHGLAAMTWVQWLIVGYTAFDTYTSFIPYYCTGATMAYTHLIWQIQTADFNNPDNLSHRFRSNNTTGAIVFAAISTAIGAQALS